MDNADSLQQELLRSEEFRARFTDYCRRLLPLDPTTATPEHDHERLQRVIQAANMHKCGPGCVKDEVPIQLWNKADRGGNCRRARNRQDSHQAQPPVHHRIRPCLKKINDATMVRRRPRWAAGERRAIETKEGLLFGDTSLVPIYSTSMAYLDLPADVGNGCFWARSLGWRRPRSLRKYNMRTTEERGVQETNKLLRKLIRHTDEVGVQRIRANNFRCHCGQSCCENNAVEMRVWQSGHFTAVIRIEEKNK